MNRLLRAFLVMVLLAAGLSATAQEPSRSETAPPRPVVSELVTLDRTQQRVFPGIIEASHETVLAFQTIGRVAQIDVESGDEVHRGDVLATLDRVTLQEEVDAARAALTAARAEVDFASQSLSRVMTLSDRGIATTAQVEQAQARDNAARAQAAAAQADLESAVEALDYGTLRSPLDGIVLARHAEQGSVIAAGTPVATLASLQGRDAVIDVPTEYIPLVGRDARFEIRAHGLDSEPVLARVRLIEPVADDTLRNRRLRLVLDDASPDFRIGGLIRARYAQDIAPIITLPRNAVLDASGAPHVWRVAPDTRIVRKVPVRLGADLGARIAIASGLEPGDEIVVKGTHSLVDGQTVGERLQ